MCCGDLSDLILGLACFLFFFILLNLSVFQFCEPVAISFFIRVFDIFHLLLL